MSIIFISHKLNEVLEIADRITVLRRGKKIDTVPREGATEEALARMMVGREVLLRVEKAPAAAGRAAARGRGPRGPRRPRPRGGARRLVRGAGGRDRRHRRRRRQRADRADRRDHRPPPDRSAGTVDGARPRARTRERARDRSTRASATSPRTASGAGSCSSSRSPRTSRCTTTTKPPSAKLRLALPAAARRARARAAPASSTCAAAARRRAPAALSGGNQQKVVLAREIDRDPRVLIAAQPTRGLDVGAIEFVHRRLVEERDEGRAILLVSLELDEILSLSDRILVIYEGQIVGEYGAGRSEEELGIAMTRRPQARGGRGMTEPGAPSAARAGEPRHRSGSPRRYDLLQRAGGRSSPAARPRCSRSSIGGLVVARRPATTRSSTYREIFNGTGPELVLATWVRSRPSTSAYNLQQTLISSRPR